MSTPEFDFSNRKLEYFKENYQNKPWKFVLREGLLKGILFWFGLMYVVVIISGADPLSWRTLLFSLMAGALGEIPFSLWIYRLQNRKLKNKQYVRS